jgi:hypothetical protein
MQKESSMTISPRAKRVAAALLSGLFLGSAALRGFGDDVHIFNPLNHPLISYRDSNVAISVTRQGKQLALAVQPTGLPQSVVQMPWGFAQVDQISMGPVGKAIIRGWGSSAVEEAVILDYSSQRLIDDFWGYDLNVSPNGRWIALTRFYAPHGSDVPIDDKYRIYDVAQSASWNRPSRPGYYKGGTPTLIEVGRPVYPLKATEIYRDSFDIQDGSEHQSASRFFWTADSGTLLFADSQQGLMSVVMVALTVTGQPQTFAVQLTDNNDVCRGDCTGIRMDSAVVSTASVTLHFKQTLVGRTLPKNARATVQLLPSQFQPAPL